MSEDIKMADFEIIDYAAGSDPKAIRLEQEVFKQRLIVKQVSKKNVELTQQVAELRAALSECYNVLGSPEYFNEGRLGGLWRVVRKALKESE